MLTRVSPVFACGSTSPVNGAPSRPDSVMVFSAVAVPSLSRYFTI
jgi:hypothetical protein